MRKLKNWTIAVLVLAIICPLLVVPASAADDAAEKHIHSLSAAGVCTACGMNVISLLNTAYIYSFPLVLMDVTDEKVTNTETATYTQAPVNQFVHVPAFADANAKDIVLPNEGLGETFLKSFSQARLQNRCGGRFPVAHFPELLRYRYQVGYDL